LEKGEELRDKIEEQFVELRKLSLLVCSFVNVPSVFSNSGMSLERPGIGGVKRVDPL